MNELREFVPTPRALEDEVKYSDFVLQVKSELDKIPALRRKELLVDLIVYVCSLVELLLPESNQGSKKKKLVVEILKDLEAPDNLDRLIELTLKSGSVAQKTLYKKGKLWLKKHFLKSSVKK